MGQVRQRGRVWWIRYYRNGRRYEESSGSGRKQDAIDLLRVKEGDIAKGLPVTSKKLTFDDAAADVVTDYKVNGKKKLAEFIASIPEPQPQPEPVPGGEKTTSDGGDADPDKTTSDGGDDKSPLEGAGSDDDSQDDT